jgi:hypothetical protein
MGDSLKHTGSGTFEVPAAAAQALERIEELCSQSKPFNAMALKDEFNETLWWGTESGTPEAEEQARQRVRALGWALQELAVWTPEYPHGLYRLQIILTTLFISSTSDREAMEAVPQEMARPSLLDGLVMLLKATDLDTRSHRHRIDDNQRHEETQTAGRSHDYRKLADLIRHLYVELSPDVHLTILLLMKFAPDRLADKIREKQDVYFSVSVRDVLTDDAPEFALSVSDVTFKFVCAFPLAEAGATNAPEGSVDVIRELLLQVAETDLWRAWIFGLVQYPRADTVAEKALPGALAQLTASQWADFVDAVELWTYAGTAGPVAKILVPFLHGLGNEKSADMWRLAFERWNKWDYGRDEKDKHLHAPTSCSFDFPVAMYYALLPLDDARAEEARLLEGIATVEQKWFTDLSELMTYRNRLSSRLRLVQHGFAIRTSPPEGANALPPCIEPDNGFAEVRYRFFDVSASMRRRR